jgi:hypothetical protein
LRTMMCSSVLERVSPLIPIAIVSCAPKFPGN